MYARCDHIPAVLFAHRSNQLYLHGASLGGGGGCRPRICSLYLHHHHHHHHYYYYPSPSPSPFALSFSLAPFLSHLFSRTFTRNTHTHLADPAIPPRLSLGATTPPPRLLTPGLATGNGPDGPDGDDGVVWACKKSVKKGKKKQKHVSNFLDSVGVLHVRPVGCIVACRQANEFELTAAHVVVDGTG